MKKLKFTAHPFLKWLTFAQCQCEPKVKAVRVNGKITEVKQPQDQSNSKMGDHLGYIHFVSFLSVAEILGKLGKFVKFY